MLAHAFETEGLSTVCIALVEEHVAKTKPPRALFVPYPFGYALGKPNDAALQHRILAAALELFERPAGPVLEIFPDDGPVPNLPQASAVPPGAIFRPPDPADELTFLRSFYEQWVDDHNGRTAVGLCGIPQRRWRGVIRFLEAYANGEDVDMRERPPDVPLAQFVRYCIDDLKAFYYEARMVQQPGISSEALHMWFWGDTALGAFIPKLTDRMTQTEDPALKAVAYGLSR